MGVVKTISSHTFFFIRFLPGIWRAQIIIMKKDRNEIIYESPQVELIEVQVEQGFATSGGTKGIGEEDGTW